MWAVVLLVRFAKLAFQTCQDLSSYPNTVPNLNGSHFVSDLNGLANDLVTNADWKRAISPSASDGVNIRTANTTALNLYVNITIFEWLWLELL